MSANLRICVLALSIVLSLTHLTLSEKAADPPVPALGEEQALLGVSEQPAKGGIRQWVKRYRSPGDGDDSARAIAADPEGNILVIGTSYRGDGSGQDYVTIKYRAGDGQQLWAKRHNRSAQSTESASALAVDAEGNVYVTGISQEAGNQKDYATIKYDPAGNELWIKRYNRSESSDDTATAIAVDAAGNVYVAGASWQQNTWEDYTTIKYDTDGNQRWVRRYHEVFSDVAVAIVVDSSGNVYVTGQSMGVGTDNDYATIKYDSDGNQLWLRRYDGPANDYDAPSGLAIDAAGNVYVTGQSLGVGTSYDYATIKYDTSGNELWVRRYNGLENSDDFVQALKVDAAGNVFVTGSSLRAGTLFDFATVKYDPTGNELWVRYYDGQSQDDWAYALAVDAGGNVYVTGESAGSSANADYAIVKYDASGQQLWVQRHDTGNADAARSLVVDTLGHVYVTGTSWGSSTGNDFLTIRYSQ